MQMCVVMMRSVILSLETFWSWTCIESCTGPAQGLRSPRHHQVHPASGEMRVETVRHRLIRCHSFVFMLCAFSSVVTALCPCCVHSGHTFQLPVKLVMNENVCSSRAPLATKRQGKQPLYQRPCKPLSRAVVCRARAFL